jgi:hypothetical protein
VLRVSFHWWLVTDPAADLLAAFRTAFRIVVDDGTAFGAIPLFLSIESVKISFAGALVQPLAHLEGIRRFRGLASPASHCWSSCRLKLPPETSRDEQVETLYGGLSAVRDVVVDRPGLGVGISAPGTARVQPQMAHVSWAVDPSPGANDQAKGTCSLSVFQLPK